ncbi:MAG: adaptor protein MecA [Roseburia sp.]
MKIEKVSENQIRCTLTKEDLADRQIKISELAYGTEKAKALFRDMMQQAAYEFGFEADDIPLMIEAIPLSADTIILVVTKVEYPEELDTRFSKFSEPDESDFFAESLGNAGNGVEQEGADDILGLFRKIQEERKNALEKEAAKAGTSKKDETGVAGKAAQKTMAEVSVPVDITKLFVFHSLEEISKLAHVLNGFYQGENDLYKDQKEHKYYLLVRKSQQTPEEFNKVCNILSEYAHQMNYTAGVLAYFREHFTLLLEKNAIQTLAEL